jgi:16S rRNA (guanine(966)-N(2))-methyltransferase RsmD
MRIVAGSVRGRRLLPPKGQDIRPTSDRNRQTLFNVLGQWIDGAVLDLYAGTGALGLEALSRGASRAVLVDASREGQELCRKNAELTGFTARAEVIGSKVDRALDALEARRDAFSLILADPPYASLAEGWLVERLALSPLLASGGRLVIESDRRTPAPPLGGWELVDERSMGDTVFRILRRA